MNRHILKECAPTLFSNYLKAMGLFKIIAEQKDSKITACWGNDRLILNTELSKGEIIEFVLKQYRPSPIVAPWNCNKYQKAITQCKDVIASERFKSYKETVDRIEDVILEFCKITKIEKFEKSSMDEKTKPLSLRLCRNTLPDDAIPWLDAVFVLTGQDVKYAPMLGSGANDGNFDMAANFLTKLKMLLDDKNTDQSKTWLESALFGKTVKLDGANMVGHNPDGAGGPNSGAGFEGKPLSNPWEYVILGPDDHDDAQVLTFIRMWSGFESESITDAQLIELLGLEDYQDVDLPDWMMTQLGVLVAKGDVTVDEFVLALQYVLEHA